MGKADRTWLNELRASLDAVDWEKLEHASGCLEELPRVLSSLAGTDEPDREAASKTLRRFFGQGGLTPAHGPIARFLFKSLSVEGAHAGGILACLASFAKAVHERFPLSLNTPHWDQYESTRLFRECWEVLAGGVPLLIPLLDRPDPHFRHGVSRVLTWSYRTALRSGTAGTPGLFPALFERLESEVAEGPFPLVSQSIAAAMSEAVEDDRAFETTVRRWLHPPYLPPVRLVAAAGILQLQRSCDPPIMIALIDGLTHWDPYFDEDFFVAQEHLRHSPNRETLVAAVRSIARYGTTSYDPHRPTPARDPSHASPDRGWIPFAPHQPPWECGRPIQEVPPVDTELGQVALKRLRMWSTSPDLHVRSRANALLLELGWGTVSDLEVLIEMVRTAEGAPLRAAVRALGRAGPAAAAAADPLLARLHAELEAPHPCPESADEDRRPPLMVLLADALAALGSAGAPAAPLVIRLLTHPQGWSLQETAVSLIRVHPDRQQAGHELCAVLSTHPDEWVRVQAAQLLEWVAAGECTHIVDALAQALQSDVDALVRYTAADLLGQFGTRAAPARAVVYEVFHREPNDPKRDSLRTTLLGTYARIAPPSEAIAFLLWVTREHPDLALHALRSIEGLGPASREALPGLLAVAERLPEQAAVVAARLIGKLGVDSPQVVDVLKGLQNSTDAVRLEATLALRRLGRPYADWYYDLTSLRQSWKTKVRVAAAEAVWESGLHPELGFETLLDVLEHDDDASRRDATLVLVSLGFAAFDAAPLLWRIIEEDFEQRTAQLDTDPLQWVTVDSVAAAGALWAMGLRTLPTLDILAHGIHRDAMHRVSLEVVRRLGPMAAPLLPALRSFQEHRTGYFPTRADREAIAAAIAAIEGSPDG